MTKVIIRDPLTSEEKGWLNILEVSIEKSLAAFYEVGYALIKIRDNRLYREHYKTFEEYCQKRWGISKTHANRLVGASHIVDNLKSNDDEFKKDDPILQSKMTPIGVKNPNWQQLPTSESHTRPLSKLPPNLQKQAWQMALESAGDKRVTARDVSVAVAKVSNIEIKETEKRIRKRIDQDKMVSEDFKRAFLAFLSMIQEARDGGWKKTSKAAALNHVYSLKTVIEV